MKEYYFEITVKFDNFAMVEIFKEFVFDLGVECIEEIDNGFIIRDEDGDKIKFALDSFTDALEKDMQVKIYIDIKCEKKLNIDWINEYKNSIKPIEVGKFYIRPYWENPSSNLNLIDILITPALAFGSGHHESTNMCLKAISKYVNFQHKSALDVGCGSGILSIALSKLGVRTSACDTDIQAIDATKDNAKNNNIYIDKIWHGSIADMDYDFKYDIVVANIIADIIVILQNDLKKCVNNNGILILSGILDKYFDRIREIFFDFKILEIFRQNEWLSFILKKEENESK